MALVAGGPTFADQDIGDPGRRCDVLAAGPLDEHRRSSGVALKEIESEQAIAACRAAINARPTTLRYAYQLGRAYLSGRQYAEAMEWIRRAADYDYKAAMHDFALLLLRHPSSPGAHEDAVAWLERAGAEGYEPAQYFLGLIFYDGTKFIAMDRVKARTWLQKAFDNGSTDAEFLLGTLYASGDGGDRNPEQAAILFERASDRGHLKARVRLARLHVIGEGVPRNHNRARALLEGLTGRTDGEAEFVLALLYLDKERNDENRDRGFDLMRSAAEGGFRPAEDQYIKMLLPLFFLVETSGADLPGSLSTIDTIAWVEARAEEGNGYAMALLRNIYEYGQGVPADEELAAAWKAWLQVAAEKEAAEAR